MSMHSSGFVPTPSTNLLAAVQRSQDVGDRQDGWDRLVKLVRPACYNWLRRKGIQPMDADDIAQQTLFGISRTIHKFEAGRRFGPWVFTILHRKWADHLERQNSKPTGQGGTDFLNIINAISDPASQQQEFDKELLKRALEIVQNEIPSTRWEAFRRVKLDGEASDSVGREMGRTTQAVYMDVFRVIRRLRDLLGDNE